MELGGAFGPLLGISDFIYLISTVISSDFREIRMYEISSVPDPLGIAENHHFECTATYAAGSGRVWGGAEGSDTSSRSVRDFEIRLIFGDF